LLEPVKVRAGTAFLRLKVKSVCMPWRHMGDQRYSSTCLSSWH